MIVELLATLHSWRESYNKEGPVLHEGMRMLHFTVLIPKGEQGTRQLKNAFGKKGILTWKEAPNSTKNLVRRKKI